MRVSIVVAGVRWPASLCSSAATSQMVAETLAAAWPCPGASRTVDITKSVNDSRCYIRADCEELKIIHRSTLFAHNLVPDVMYHFGLREEMATECLFKHAETGACFQTTASGRSRCSCSSAFPVGSVLVDYVASRWPHAVGP